MNKQEFEAFYIEISNKESVLDDTCKNLIRFGGFSRHLMERFGLIRYAGIKGKTRIVIEYNNDTGEGWMRVVSEDPVTQPIQKCQSVHPEHPPGCPIDCEKCVGDKHHQQLH